MPLKKAKPTRAKRLSPAARRSQILDSAASLILKKGLLSCTLEETALEAGISKPLIYRYFTKREDLLKELLTREYEYLRDRRLLMRDEGGWPRDASLQDGFQRVFEYLYERGPLIRIMTAEPTLRKLVHYQEEKIRTDALRKTATRGVAAFGVPDDVALIATMVSANAPITSARFLKEHNISALDAATVWTEFTLGGWKALIERFGRKDPSVSGASEHATAEDKDLDRSKRAA